MLVNVDSETEFESRSNQHQSHFCNVSRHIKKYLLFDTIKFLWKSKQDDNYDYIKIYEEDWRTSCHKIKVHKACTQNIHLENIKLEYHIAIKKMWCSYAIFIIQLNIVFFTTNEYMY